MVRTLLSDPRVAAVAQAFAQADESTQQAVEAFLNDPMPAAIDGTDDWETAAKAYKRPDIVALDRLVNEVLEAWAARMAHGILNNNNLVDQREIDFRRGPFVA